MAARQLPLFDFKGLCETPSDQQGLGKKDSNKART